MPTERQVKSETEWLKQALQKQFLVQSDARLAAELAPLVAVQEFESGATLMKEGGSDNELFFILEGDVSVQIGGHEIAALGAGRQVGELALLNCSERRTATVVAKDLVKAAKITRQDFARVACRHPELWQRMAVDLGDKLTNMASRGMA